MPCGSTVTLLVGVTLRQNWSRSGEFAMANFIGVHVADGWVKVVRKDEKSTKHKRVLYWPVLARLQPGRFWVPPACEAEPVDELALGTPPRVYVYEPLPFGPVEELTLRVTP